MFQIGPAISYNSARCTYTIHAADTARTLEDAEQRMIWHLGCSRLSMSREPADREHENPIHHSREIQKRGVFRSEMILLGLPDLVERLKMRTGR